MACRILVAQPGIEAMPYALVAQSLNYWITRKVCKMHCLGTVSLGSLVGLSVKVPCLPIAMQVKLSHWKILSLKFNSFLKIKLQMVVIHSSWWQHWKKHLQTLSRNPNTVLAAALFLSGFSAWFLNLPFNSVNTLSSPVSFQQTLFYF